MSEASLQLGQEVKTVYFHDGEHIETGVCGVEKITVVMENGQMAGVPWFAVWRDGKIDTKWNAALVQGVEL